MAHSGPEWRQDRVDRELKSVVPGTLCPWRPRPSGCWWAAPIDSGNGA